MARAWEQAGAVSEANAAPARARSSRASSAACSWSGTWRRCSPPQLVAMTRAAHARIALTGGTVDAALQASRVPEAAVSGAMRRLASPQGVLARARRPGPAGGHARRRRPGGDDARPPAPPNGMVMMAAVAPQAARGHPPGAVRGRRCASSCSSASRPRRRCWRGAMARVTAPAGTWTRPDPLAPATTGPRFAEPMFDGLQRMAPWLFLPGVENVEADGVALLETTPRVIEAYMAGLNHELSRELLWREFPAALAGTAFRQFWDVSGQPGDAESLADIPPIAEWAGAPLGGSTARRRRPARPARARRAAAPLPDDDDLRRARNGGGRWTRRRGWRRCSAPRSPPDIVLVGFALSEEARGSIRPGPAGTSSSSSTRASRASGSTRSPTPASRPRRTRWPGRTCRSRRPATPT